MAFSNYKSTLSVVVLIGFCANLFLVSNAYSRPKPTPLDGNLYVTVPPQWKKYSIRVKKIPGGGCHPTVNYNRSTGLYSSCMPRLGLWVTGEFAWKTIIVFKKKKGKAPHKCKVSIATMCSVLNRVGEVGKCQHGPYFGKQGVVVSPTGCFKKWVPLGSGNRYSLTFSK